MKKMILLYFTILILQYSFAQNIGISNPAPTEKLHVDSGSIKIGKLVWSASSPVFLKFGDANYITVGEEEADDILTIRAKELRIRPSTSYTTVPVSIQGSANYSHFYIGTNEDTYLRAGKTNGNVIINDIPGGKVGVGMNNPTRAMFEQYGSIGTTAAIFGGDGAGISLQKNWPVIGFNHYFDGNTHRSIGAGYSGVFGVNQNNGSLYYASWSYASIPNAALSGYTEGFFVSRLGSIGLGTGDPQSNLHIIQRNSTLQDDGPDMGITMEGFQSDQAGSGQNRWNIHAGYYALGISTSLGCFEFSKRFSNGNWSVASVIGGNGQYFQTSDRNLKKDIQPLDQCLTQISLLKPVKYHFKESSQNSPYEYGFVAQDVEAVFPQFIATTANLKMVSYSSFIPILTKGMQEQQQQIESLQKENESIKKQLQELKKMFHSNK